MICCNILDPSEYKIVMHYIRVVVLYFFHAAAQQSITEPPTTQPPTTQPPTTQHPTTPVDTLAAPSVAVTAPAPAIAGSSFTLTCTISLPAGVLVVPDVRWQGPAVTAGSAPSTVTGLGPTYTSELTINPLTLSHGGQYTCTASYTVDGGTSPHGTNTVILTVTSE